MGETLSIDLSFLWIILAVFGVLILLPLLAAFIILLVQCIKHKWTRKLLIPFIIIAAILGTMMLSGLIRLLV